MSTVLGGAGAMPASSFNTNRYTTCISKIETNKQPFSEMNTSYLWFSIPIFVKHNLCAGYFPVGVTDGRPPFLVVVMVDVFSCRVSAPIATCKLTSCFSVQNRFVYVESYSALSRNFSPFMKHVFQTLRRWTPVDTFPPYFCALICVFISCALVPQMVFTP